MYKTIRTYNLKRKGWEVMLKIILGALLLFFAISGVASAAEGDIFEIKTGGNYRMEAGSSVELAKKVALFTAKRKAADLAGRYLSRKSLIKVYELNRDEIYSLAAREIEAKILKEKLINKRVLLPTFLSDYSRHPANASGFARRFC